MSMEQSNRRNNELNSWIDKISDENLKHYIRHRVLPQMQFYSNKSQKYRSSYFRWINASIFISFLIPIASVFSDGSILMKAVIAALGAAIAGITSYINVHSYKELWVNYRFIREQIYTILLYYFTSSGDFSGKQQEEQNHLLVESCEKIFKSENQTWKEKNVSTTE